MEFVYIIFTYQYLIWLPIEYKVMLLLFFTFSLSNHKKNNLYTLIKSILIEHRIY